MAARRAKRWVAILGFVILLLLLVVGGLWLAARAVPSWYRSPTAAGADLARVDLLARRLEDRLIEARNAAGAIAAAEAKARRSGTPAPEAAADGSAAGTEVEIRLPTAELTAFALKWAKLEGWEGRYAEHLRDPVVTVVDGAVVVGGVSTATGGVMGLHLRPELETDGRLLLRLDRVTAGRLTLPRALVSGPLASLREPLARGIERWSKDARVDAVGLANLPTAYALAGRVILGTLDARPVDPVVALPVDDRRGVLATVTALRVEGSGDDGAIVVRLRPVPPKARPAMVARLKG